MFKEKIPVTLVGGFLGAGKTTLVNRLLSAGDGRRYGVIVNEFGAANVDSDLIKYIAEDTSLAELEGGCICCVGNEDLSVSLYSLITAEQPPEHIVVELSGLADPVPVAQTILTTQWRDVLDLDGIVAVADARNLITTLKENPEGSAQLAYASVVVLNKADLVTDDEFAEARRLITNMNPLAGVITATHCQLDSEQVVGLAGFDPSWKPQGHAHVHDERVGSVTLRSEQPLILGHWVVFHQTMIMNRAERVYRAKGILNFEELDDPMVLQAVRELYTFDTYEGQTDGASELVIIGRDLDETEYTEAFERVMAERPANDQRLGSPSRKD